MTLISPHWVIACSVQIAALVACGVLLARLLRLRKPQVRWACYEGVLLLCLCLPLLQMRPAAKTVMTPASWGTERLQASPIAESAPVAQATSSVNLQRAFVWLLVTGILLRTGWLLLGFRGLYRLRRAARQFRDVPRAVRALRDGIGANTELLISDRVQGAITFGLRSGVILLPSQFGEMSEGTQVAILCHELIHVRCRHWLFTVIEECVLSLFWFHPAVWWLVREIQLGREEAVDLEAVRLLNSRDQYVEALMVAAQIRQRIRLAPATSFVWRGQFARRVATIFAAETFSSRRTVLSVAGVVIGTLSVLCAAVVYFPVRFAVHAQSASTEPVVIESGGDHLLRRGALEYPRWVQQEGVEGLVEAEVSTDKLGRVLDARILDGPDELRRPVLRSVLDWQYDPQAKAPGTYQIAIRFTLPPPGYAGVGALPAYPETAELRNTRESNNPIFFFESAQQPAATETISQMIKNSELAERGDLSGRIDQIKLHGGARRMDLHLPVAVGDELTAESLQRLDQSLHSIDRRLLLALGKEPGDRISIHILYAENGPPRGDGR